MNLIFHWPQYCWLAMVVLNIGVQVAMGVKKGEYPTALISGTVLNLIIMYYGGFFAGATP